jgi:glycerol-3-phosphate cytidylyltransferase
MRQKIVGFTCSAFDLLHAGHIQMLREAREQCDYLICGLQMDPSIDRPTSKNPPIQSIVERYIQLRSVSYVDEIIPYNTERDLEDILTSYRIDVRILGEEYRNKDFTGKDICRSRGIDLYFNKRDHRFSSTELRQRVYEREYDNTRNDRFRDIGLHSRHSGTDDRGSKI